MKTWVVHSRAIREVVKAPDQFVAFDSLRDRSLLDFGIVVTAEPDESGDPFAIRTSALMFRWGRDEDAKRLINAAISAGLPDTTELDRQQP